MSDFNEREEAIFDEARNYTDPARRATYLDLACGSDPALRRRIETLLSADQRADDFLATDGQLPEAKTIVATDTAQISEGPGDTIGKYKLLEQIGEGGMGVVYMAEQSVPFVKRVALKIIKLGMDTKAVVARFNAEYQALALMNHPSIAKVLDAGATDTGRPYFVMEYVRGIPITEYCDQHKLSTRQRLELFIPVCQAVQHAHQKGIIHRDIKPSNVLVANFDGRPAPMVIDFGIAKAVNQRLSQETFFTRHGQFIGTLEYIAPEQAEGSQIDIDTRADIYSLGVLLYQLLTGTTPFPGKRLRESAWRETMRIIQEEEPQKPSDRMSTLTAEQGTTIEKTHGGEAARKISLVLRQELDLVVMACLEKDRTRRYETANALAKDLERYLQGEAVSRVPPKAGYLLAKFARKHKKTVAMAAAIAVILAGATLFSTWQAIRATRAETLTKKQVEKLAAINGWMNRDLLPQVNAWTGGQVGQQRSVDIKLKDAILQSAQRLSEDFKEHPEIEGEIRLTIGTALQVLGMAEEAEKNLRRAIELLKATVGAKHTNTLGAQRNLGAILTQVAFGQTAERQKQLGVEARQLLEETYAVSEETVGADHLLSIEAGLELGLHHVIFKNLDAGEELLEKLQRTVGPLVPTNTNFPPNLQVGVAMWLGELRFAQERRPEARKISRQLVAFAQEASQYPERGRLSTLEVLRLTQPKAFWLWRWDRDFEQAERLILQGLATSRKLVNDGAPTESYILLARDLFFQQQDYEKSYRYAREAADLNVRAFGPDGGHFPIHALWIAAGTPAATADWAGQASELRRQRLELKVQDGILVATEALATHLSGDPQSVGELRKQYVQMLQNSFGRPVDKTSFTHPADRTALTAMMSLPCSSEELPVLKQGVEEATRLQGTEGWWVRQRAGEVLEGILAYRMGRPAEAIKLLEPVLSAIGNHRTAYPWHYILAMAYRESGDRATAIARLEKAEHLLAEFLERGITGEPGESTAFAAQALVLRDEATKLIQPTVPLPPITKETLAPKRAQWTEIRNLVEAGDLLARRRKFEEASRKFEAAINHPAFRWKAANEGLNEFAYRAFAVRWALGDCPGHIEILRLMHEGIGETETPHLYQLVELACPLPPELEVRKQKCQARKRLEDAWDTDREKVSNEDSYVLGQLWYRDGKYPQAIEALHKPMNETTLRFPVSAKAFAAMAHWQLQTDEHRDEARRLLKEADERFNKTVIVPGEGMYPPWFPMCVMMEMVIKEADREIDPGVVNAPHVAALPPEGWSP